MLEKLKEFHRRGHTLVARPVARKALYSVTFYSDNERVIERRLLPWAKYLELVTRWSELEGLRPLRWLKENARARRNGKEAA
jgi:hypothetical protein